MTLRLFRPSVAAVLLSLAGCPRGEAREPVAQPTEVEIEWPDAGAGSSESPAAPNPPEPEAVAPGKTSSDPE